MDGSNDNITEAVDSVVVAVKMLLLNGQITSFESKILCHSIVNFNGTLMQCEKMLEFKVAQL